MTPCTCKVALVYWKPRVSCVECQPPKGSCTGMCHGQGVDSGIDAYAQEANAPNVILPNMNIIAFIAEEFETLS